MPHYPKPFFRKSRQLWYVQIDGRQINLGPDRDAAFTQYRDLMATPKSPVAAITAPPRRAARGGPLRPISRTGSSCIARPAPISGTGGGCRAFARRYPELTIDELRPFHVQEWVDGQNIATTTQRNCIRAVKRSIKWAHRQGYIDSNPLAELEAPSAGRREVLISDDEYALLLNAIRDPSFLRPRRHHLGNWLSSTRIAASRSAACGHQEPTVGFSQIRIEEQAAVARRVPHGHRHDHLPRVMTKYPEGPLFRNSRGMPLDQLRSPVRIQTGKSTRRQGHYERTRNRNWGY